MPPVAPYVHADTQAACMLSAALKKSHNDGLSVRKLATRLGYRQATVLSHMANGRQPIPLDRAEAIAREVGIDPQQFLLAVLEQRHPSVSWTEMFNEDPVARDLVRLAGRPLSDLPKDQLRVVKEAVCDPSAPRRWLSPLEAPIIEVVRSVRPEVATEGLRGADLDLLGLALSPNRARRG